MGVGDMRHTTLADDTALVVAIDELELKKLGDADEEALEDENLVTVDDVNELRDGTLPVEEGI